MILPPFVIPGGRCLADRKTSRLTWGGLMRILHRRTETNFGKEHVKVVYPDGHRDYLNIKYDAQGYPYFIVVRERRRY